MSRYARMFVWIAGIAALGAGVLVQQAARAAETPEKKVKVLLVTGGEIHDWKGVGQAVQETLEKYGRFDVTKVENDLGAFQAERLKPYDMVVFYWTLGTLTPEQKQGITEFVKGGKGFVTFHSGADSFRGDKDWHDFVGGHFVGHPAYRPYPVTIVDKAHPILKGVDGFTITDEQYYLDYNKDKIKVLATGPGPREGAEPMPAIWVQPLGQGRIFYMGFGHDAKAARDANFQKILPRATLWAAGAESLEARP